MTPWPRVPRHVTLQALVAVRCFCTLGLGAALCYGAQPDAKSSAEGAASPGVFWPVPVSPPVPGLDHAPPSPDYSPGTSEDEAEASSSIETDNFNNSADPVMCNGRVCIYPAIETLSPDTYTPCSSTSPTNLKFLLAYCWGDVLAFSRFLSDPHEQLAEARGDDASPEKAKTSKVEHTPPALTTADYSSSH
ncbi:hypothetical protein CYMTET_50582 [Cymbomonas tetramitiformis]|uniref:Uncharacterized protein n=1 Tax=Cymbomonas tetramitiformis TaxID=36881 RepID=A0AAE0BP45_9CHLO|nr:hypothetical protein CYMTET_50582 [Cymbomonas tetramitiformis]